MNEPMLRFPEFKNSWKNYKIEDIFDRVGVSVNLDSTQTYREIGIRSHGKGIFHKEETTVAEIGNKRVFWVEPDCFVVNIVFAWERAVAKTTEKENGMIASHRFPMYRPKKDIVDLDYITEYFVTKHGQNVLTLASPGGAGRNKTLGQKEFAKSIVKLPSLPEQQKIADFLSMIDTVIQKQKETLSAWEERKKGVMQKLFSQEVRFKADDGSEFSEWEEEKLGDISVRVTRKNKDNITDIPLTISSADGLIDQRNFFNKVVASKDMSGYYLLKKGEFAYNKSYSKGYDFGSIKRLDLYDEGALSTLYICFALNEDENSDFYQKYFDSLSWYSELQKICAEGARNHGLLNVPTNDFFEIKLYVPVSKQEQQKIADCLSVFDEVIEKQRATLAAWEELKKGLLQQMFV